MIRVEYQSEAVQLKVDWELALVIFRILMNASSGNEGIQERLEILSDDLRRELRGGNMDKWIDNFDEATGEITYQGERYTLQGGISVDEVPE